MTGLTVADHLFKQPLRLSVRDLCISGESSLSVIASREAAWLWYSTFVFMPGTGRPRVSGLLRHDVPRNDGFCKDLFPYSSFDFAVTRMII